MNTSDCTGALKELNLQTFQAEEGESVGSERWDEFLRRVLADGFAIRRSDPKVSNQNREAMIRWINEKPVVKRKLIVDELQAWCTDTLGVVVCPIEQVRDGVVRKYQNIKVFRREPPGDWQCVCWQVTEAPVSEAAASSSQRG
jgi:hypothetical protein